MEDRWVLSAGDVVHALARERSEARDNGLGIYTPEQLLAGLLDPVHFDLPAHVERWGEDMGPVAVGMVGTPRLDGAPGVQHGIVEAEIPHGLWSRPRAAWDAPQCARWSGVWGAGT